MFFKWYSASSTALWEKTEEKTQFWILTSTRSKGQWKTHTPVPHLHYNKWLSLKIKVHYCSSVLYLYFHLSNKIFYIYYIMIQFSAITFITSHCRNIFWTIIGTLLYSEVVPLQTTNGETVSKVLEDIWVTLYQPWRSCLTSALSLYIYCYT